MTSVVYLFKAALLSIPFFSAASVVTPVNSAIDCTGGGDACAAPLEAARDTKRGPDVNSLIQGPLLVERLSLDEQKAKLQLEEQAKLQTAQEESARSSAGIVDRGAHGCAVCFIGELRHLRAVRSNMQAHLLKPIASEGIGVDVFVAGPSHGPYDMDDFGLGPVVNRSSGVDLSFLQLVPKVEGVTLRDFRFGPEISPEELRNMLKRRVRASVLEYYQKSAPPGSNWLEPVFGEKDRGHALQIYRHDAECKEMVIAHEESRKSQYKWWIRTRPDFEWLAPHPPLSLLGDTKVWLFDTEEWEGVNMRHVVGRRNLVQDTVMSRFDVIMDGDPLVLDMHEPGLMNDEKFSLLLLQKRGIHWGHIPTIAHLTACPKWANQCWRSDNKQMYAEEENAAISNSASFTMYSCWTKASEDKLKITASGQCNTRSLLQTLGIPTDLTPKRLIGMSVCAVLISIVFAIFFFYDAVVLFWMAIGYFAWSVSISFTNKYVMHAGRFPHPVTLVTLHMLACTAVCTFLPQVVPSWFPPAHKLDTEQIATVKMGVLTIAACFAMSLCLENAALYYSSVAFLQMVKEPSLILVAALNFIIGTDGLTRKRVALLIVTVIGGVLCVNGEVHLSMLGFTLQATGCLCNAMRLALQGKLLVKNAGLKLGPISYVGLVAPACLVALIPATCFECYFSQNNVGVFTSLREWWAPILASCVLAAGVNIVIAAVVQRISSLGFCLMGSVKSACIIVIFFVFMDSPTTVKQIGGTVVVLGSVMLYAIVKSNEGS